MPTDITPAFNYAALDAATFAAVQECTGTIRRLAQRMAADIHTIGGQLLQVKALLPHGQFGPWLQAEFAWSHDTATRFMAVAERFTTLPADADFAPSALYYLAGADIPPAARTAAVAQAASGARITVATAERLVDQHRPHPATAAELSDLVIAWGTRWAEQGYNPRQILQACQHEYGVKNFRALEAYISATLPGRPYTSQDLRSALAAALAHWPAPASPAPPAAPDETPAKEPEPVALDPAELAAEVTAWLAHLIEDNELPDDRDARRMVLRGLLTGRNDQYAPYWRSLRAWTGWPETATSEDVLAAVRAALDDLTPAEKRAPSWAGVQPISGPAPHYPSSPSHTSPPSPASERLADLRAALDAYLLAGDQALAYLASPPAERQERDRLACIAALERARAQALGVSA